MMVDSGSGAESGKPGRSLFEACFCWIAFLVVSLAGGFSEPSHGQVTDNAAHTNGDEVSLADLITKLRQENELVGLAAMVMVDGKVVDSAVDGERKHGTGEQLETGDRWHLGSITKSMTATMIARMIESGQMKWSDTVGDCFADASIHKDWKPVTLRQLLTHTSGAPANFSVWVKLRSPALGPDSRMARRKAVLDICTHSPENLPGSTFAYSNVGYTIAGAMAEEVAGVPWSDLIKREIFEPLNLTGSGFGPPESSDENVEQPRGHSTLFGWKVSHPDNADNTSVIGPAGTIHMTLHDLCTYASEHMRGHAGAGKLLSVDSYTRLHMPDRDQYACGWMKIDTSAEVPHAVYWHNGSNTMWYALVVFVPEKKLVVAVVSNDGDVPKAEAAAWEVVGTCVPTGVYPKKSPFNAVRWQESQPEVKLGDAWFRLVSLDDLPASAIIAFSQQTYGEQWRMRFEEDLVEVLSRMGHPPQPKVTLVIQSLPSLEKSTREGVPMTAANRRAIKEAARWRAIADSGTEDPLPE